MSKPHVVIIILLISFSPDCLAYIFSYLQISLTAINTMTVRHVELSGTNCVSIVQGFYSTGIRGARIIACVHLSK